MKLKIIFIFSIFILFVLYFLLSIAFADTNINSSYRYAWNDAIGWIDFYSTVNVNIYNDRLEGYASSSVGYIALNCNSTPNGNICGTSNFKISNNGSGYLSGWAYNDAIGWISFDSSTATSSITYQVVVDFSTGDFSGWAWNENIGWISFNCNNSGIGNTCGVSDYKVKTNWNTVSSSGNLTSSVFDSQALNGAAINGVIWQGALNNGEVKFQISSSNSLSGPWSYKGSDGTENTYYNSGGPNVASKINPMYHNNHRYFRYKIFLYSNVGQTQSPRVDDVIINWSP